MRELKIVGLDLDGKHIICEGANPADKYKIRVDDRLRAAVRGDGARVAQTHIDIEVTNMLSPRDIQARIRAGASAAHPVLGDGPSVLTLLETVTASLVARGLNPDNITWDAWRNEDGRWTVQ